jgi:peptidoglycan/xylan/chitin deacetylase (PgdA/CDA1 family)
MKIKNKTFYSIITILCVFTCCSINEELIENDKKAVISFIFDDLNTSDIEVKLIFDEFGFKPSFALVGNRINDTTIKLYKQFYEDSISILAHSFSHPRMNDFGSITKNEVYEELITSKNIIEKHGIKVKGFVTPSSELHSNFISIVDTIFDYSFTQKTSKFNKTVKLSYLSRFGIESNISKDDHNIYKITNKIDSAIKNNELLVLYGHQIPSTYSDVNGKSLVSKQDLRKILSYLKLKVDSGQCLVLPSDLAIENYFKLDKIK